VRGGRSRIPTFFGIRGRAEDVSSASAVAGFPIVLPFHGPVNGLNPLSCDVLRLLAASGAALGAWGVASWPAIPVATLKGCETIDSGSPIPNSE
jgi:hypothetical protein